MQAARFSTDRCRSLGYRLGMGLAAVVLALAALVVPNVHAQTTTVNAANDLSCLGTRIGRNGICTAKEFSTIVNFTQPSASAITSCVAGSFLNVDVVADISGTNADRYDVGIFFGQTGNLPETNNAANLCSVATFPSAPLPFAELDPTFAPPTPDACGDFVSGGTATLRINAVKVFCAAAPNSNELAVPYTIAWNAQQAYACNASALIPKPDSKCLTTAAGTLATLVGLQVQGWVTIIKSTQPTGATTSFSFTASASPAVALSTSSFSLSSSQSITITVPLSSTTRVVTVTEALTSGWGPNASISCTDPAGNAASYVTVDNVNRRLVANLTGTNYGAICTVTNTKQTRVRAMKTVLPAANTGTFNLSVQSTSSSTQALGVGDGGSTTFAATTGGTVTVTETAAAGSSMTKYVTSANCVNDETGAAVALTSSSLAGATTRTVTLTPSLYTDVSCRLTNTRAANLAISKTNTVTSVVAGATTLYTITVSNSGPSDADGSVLTDPPAAGLNCTAVSSCTPSGGAICPALLSISALQGAGLSIPALPSGGSLSFGVTCAVTASGS